FTARAFCLFLASTVDRVAQSKGEERSEPDGNPWPFEAQIAVNITGQETLKPVGSLKRREGLLTIRGYVLTTHIIVLVGCWYLILFLANASDEAGMFGITWLIGFFLLAEFIFTNDWLVA